MPWADGLFGSGLTFLGEAVGYDIIAIKHVKEEEVYVRRKPALDVIHTAAEEGDAICLMHFQARPALARLNLLTTPDACLRPKGSLQSTGKLAIVQC